MLGVSLDCVYVCSVGGAMYSRFKARVHFSRNKRTSGFLEFVCHLCCCFSLEKTWRAVLMCYMPVYHPFEETE